MHGDHSRKEPFYQQVRKLHPNLHNAPKLQHLKIYRSTNSPFYASQHQKSTAKQQRISTASTAKKENLQQRKLQHLKIYRSTNSPFYASQHQKSTANQQRISTASTAKKENLQQQTTASEIYSKTAENFYSKKALTSREQSTKEIIYSISDKLHKAPTKDYIKEVTFQTEFKSHFLQDLETSLSNSWTLSTPQPTNSQI